MGGLKGHRVQIEGNNIFEIRKYVRPCFTSVNRPQASHLLPHITHSIEVYIYISMECVVCVRTCDACCRLACVSLVGHYFRILNV